MRPTCQLRFILRKVVANGDVSIQKILQQLWVDENTFENEWRDVPLSEVRELV
jgi:hypothetical protein